MQKTALLSVYDKTGLVEFAQSLAHHGYQLLASGGTAHLLQDKGLSVQLVEDITGQKQLFGGRVKTLHPTIHAGILARNTEADLQELESAGFPRIDIVCVNLYPFAAVVADPTTSAAERIEMIDIGGPAMLRAASKNHARVAAICNPSAYGEVIAELDETGEISANTRESLAREGFEHTADYDANISAWFNEASPGSTQSESPTLPKLPSQWQLHTQFRYGENPHQQAYGFTANDKPVTGILQADILQGKEMSWNNWQDADAALNLVSEFSESESLTPVCAIIKHANPCGVAAGATAEQAWARACEADATSAFGGIIAFNVPLTLAAAKAITDFGFVEIIMAPKIEQAAKELLAKKKQLRLLELNAACWQRNKWRGIVTENTLFVQQADNLRMDDSNWKTVTENQPSDQQKIDLLFAWKIARHVKSNAVVYVKDQQTVGVGAGQMSRVFSTVIAGLKAEDAGLCLEGSVAASDAFFPFRDGLETLAKQGVKAVVQPGGSIRDEEVISAANEHQIAMRFTGQRLFRH